MSKSRKEYRCNNHNVVSSYENSTSKQYGSKQYGSKLLFPTDIKKLLILIAEDEGEKRVNIVLDACSDYCFIEDARVIAVLDNTVVIKDSKGYESKFRFVRIDCICEVIVGCDVILDELFEQRSYNRE